MEPTDQQIVQQYADAGRLNELPPGNYVLTEPVIVSTGSGKA